MISTHEFNDKDELAQALAESVANDLIRLLSVKPKVSLSVPGGTTPALFFNYLSQDNRIEWPRVNILANDERCVANSDARSNERLLRETLLVNAASSANLISLYGRDEKNNTDGLIEEISPSINPALPLDICVLGMGEDGHTASLFPDAIELDSALDKSNASNIMVMNVPNMIINGVKEIRVSFTFSAILQASSHYLLITGKEKLAIVSQAKQDKNKKWPISFVLNDTNTKVFYSL